MGMFGALGFAAWIGVPTILLFAVHRGQIRSGIISPIEIGVVFLLVGFALFTAWRFRDHKGLIVGPILLVALVVEVAKRILLTLDGTRSFGIFDAVVTFMMFFGLLNGIRGVRAIRHLSPDEDLADVFQ
jgi:hypothetical protein